MRLLCLSISPNKPRNKPRFSLRSILVHLIILPFVSFVMMIPTQDSRVFIFLLYPHCYQIRDVLHDLFATQYNTPR